MESLILRCEMRIQWIIFDDYHARMRNREDLQCIV